jgi:hypothetical protein
MSDKRAVEPVETYLTELKRAKSPSFQNQRQSHDSFGLNEAKK